MRCCSASWLPLTTHPASALCNPGALSACAASRCVAVHALIEQERILTARALGEREDEFMKLKVQGVLDAAEVLVVALPPGREQHVFGRRTLPEMDLASAACAIQNLWLAARSEGLGMGWVSMFPRSNLRNCCRCPRAANPLPCCAWARSRRFTTSPCCRLKTGRTAPLADMVFEDYWAKPALPHASPHE